MLDDIAQAVLAREEVVKYLRGGLGERGDQARERIYGYLEELRTTQRPSIYRALQHPLYPILRKIERKHENLHHAANAVRNHRVVYASNHKSHTDYLVEPLVLDDNGIRPPLIAAGINLFGGPLGLIHKHVTGAIPIRRATRGTGVATVNPFRAVRIAMLAKASSIVGAVVGGMALGLILFLLTRPVTPSLGSMGTTIATAVSAALLVTAGLVAEHLCTIRKDDDDEQPGGNDPGLTPRIHDH